MGSQQVVLWRTESLKRRFLRTKPRVQQAASTLAAFGIPLPSDNMFGGNNVWAGVTGPRLGQGAVSGIFG